LNNSLASASNNAQPLFSIITVSRNAEKTIRKCIESVLNQTELDFEYIVIDGASIDGTMEVVNEYLNDISQVVSEPDLGIQDAYNKGINMASGKYIGILNADDQYMPHTLQIVKESIMSLEFAETILYGGMVFTDNRDEYLYVSHLELNERMICHPTCFIPRSVHARFGNYDLDFRIASDYDLISRFNSHGVAFQGIDKPLVIYSRGGISSQKKYTSIVETVKIQKKYNKWSSFKFIYELLRNVASLNYRKLIS
jgi:glycosyltransferase involved in cell wall biosynthesis